jgi:hypothetical protein
LIGSCFVTGSGTTKETFFLCLAGEPGLVQGRRQVRDEKKWPRPRSVEFRIGLVCGVLGLGPKAGNEGGTKRAATYLCVLRTCM